jgi:hypothetical protein
MPMIDNHTCQDCGKEPCWCNTGPEYIVHKPVYPGEKFPPGTGEYIIPNYAGLGLRDA